MSVPPKRFDHKVAVVTGGASGIGRATVELLLREGAKVLLGDINWSLGKTVLSNLKQSGYSGRVSYLECDVNEEVDISRLVREAVNQFGRLDIMVNNAGTGGAIGPLIDTRVEDWDRTFGLISRSVFLGMKHAATTFIQQGQGGAIVNVASVAGMTGGAGGAAYSSAKSAVINLTRVGATQLSKHRIRCNAVSPGTILTPLLLRGADPEAMREAALYNQPWPEIGTAEQIASIVAFLASDESRFINGENILADGGSAASFPNLYGGNHPLGNAIVERMTAANVQSFDHGSTQTMGDAEAMTPKTSEPKTFLITGVTKGLGRAMVEKLAALGHRIVGCARSAESVQELQQTYGVGHRFDVVDISDDDQVKQWAAKIKAEKLVLDFILNNAAISNRSSQIWRLTAEEFETVVRVNLLGTANVLRHFVPLLMEHRHGVIVNFSSGWGRESAERVGPYCASKWAVEGLTKVLSKEIPPTMAAVSLHPGIINTDNLQHAFGEAAALYPKPKEWADVAVPYILQFSVKDNGRALSVPGMTEFRGMGKLKPFLAKHKQD